MCKARGMGKSPAQKAGKPCKGWREERGKKKGAE
jgi:hypothetical protein